MDIVKTLSRIIRAVLGYYHEADRVDSWRTKAAHDGVFERRMNGVSNSYRALLLGSPGR